MKINRPVENLMIFGAPYFRERKWTRREIQPRLLEPKAFEPGTSALQGQRSTELSYRPIYNCKLLLQTIFVIKCGMNKFVQLCIVRNKKRR